MTYKLLHIGVTFPFAPRTEQLDRVLSVTGDDWIRYAANNWIVWTQKNATQMYQVFQPHLSQAEQILVLSLDRSDGFGFASKWIWDWFELKRRSPQTTLADIFGQLVPPKNPGSLPPR